MSPDDVSVVLVHGSGNRIQEIQTERVANEDGERALASGLSDIPERGLGHPCAFIIFG